MLPFKIDVTPYHIRVSLSGLEPETYGLTCRTGFHPPESSCGLDFPISRASLRWGAARQVSEEPLAGFLLIAQSDGLSRKSVPPALRGFQHMVRFYLRPSGRGTPKLKSVALPTELPSRLFSPQFASVLTQRLTGLAPSVDSARESPVY